MSTDSSIEWTDATWNPTRGCSRISPGCGGGIRGPNGEEGGCYAEVMAGRFSKPGLWGHGFATKEPGKLARWTRKVALIPEKLDLPLHWKEGRRVFVNSTSDLFHEDLTNEQIAAVFGVMAACPQHTFQMLTKRATRMRAWFEWRARQGAGDRCRVEQQGRGIWRAPSKTRSAPTQRRERGWRRRNGCFTFAREW